MELLDIDNNVPVVAVDVGLNQQDNVNGSVETIAVPCARYCPDPLREIAISYEPSGFEFSKSDITTTSSSEELMAPPANVCNPRVNAIALVNELNSG